MTLEDMNKFIYFFTNVMSFQERVWLTSRLEESCKVQKKTSWLKCVQQETSVSNICVMKINCMYFDASVLMEYEKTHLSGYHC